MSERDIDEIARQVAAEGEVIAYLGQNTTDEIEGGEGMRTLLLRSANRLLEISRRLNGGGDDENS